jgi:hypothetical protein
MRSTVVRDGVIWEIDPKERTFTRVDAASLKQAVGGESSQIEAMIARLPPEKRALMESRMAQMKQKAANTEYTSDTGGATIPAVLLPCMVNSATRSRSPSTA